MDNNNNLARQIEELEALNAIYADQWHVENQTDSYSIEITATVKLFITLHDNYPSLSAPTFELLAPTLSLEQKNRITNAFQTIHRDNAGEAILFQWIEKLKEIATEEDEGQLALSSVAGSNNANDRLGAVIGTEPTEDVRKMIGNEFDSKITHGLVIRDRKSAFQGHAVTVQSPDDIRQFMDCLMENKKIAQATHNISAYRVTVANGSVLQDCDDDGESHAGGRLLHLLQILSLNNVMVVVSRWYGGIHLGPDRFKHINNAARQVLVESGLLQS